MIPDFEEFLDYLKENNSSYFDSAAFDKHYLFQDGITPENLSAFFQEYTENVLTSSATWSLKILRAYHEWLQQHAQ